jgi:hypothetical protein
MYRRPLFRTKFLFNKFKNYFRLVLSNQSKKWISADGVEKIQLVSEVNKYLYRVRYIVCTVNVFSWETFCKEQLVKILA